MRTMLKYSAMTMIALLAIASFMPVAAQVFTSISLSDGNARQPTVTFLSDATAGLFRSGTGVVGVSNLSTPFVTVNITPVATAAAIGTTQQTFTVAGLATSDRVYLNTTPTPTSLCPATGVRVSAANTLQVDFTTLTAVACTPAAGNYNLLVVKAQ